MTASKARIFRIWLPVLLPALMVLAAHAASAVRPASVAVSASGPRLAR